MIEICGYNGWDPIIWTSVGILSEDRFQNNIEVSTRMRIVYVIFRFVGFHSMAFSFLFHQNKSIGGEKWISSSLFSLQITKAHAAAQWGRKTAGLRQGPSIYARFNEIVLIMGSDSGKQAVIFAWNNNQARVIPSVNQHCPLLSQQYRFPWIIAAWYF